MKKYFTDFQKAELIKKGMSPKQIRDLNESIHLYYKKYTKLDIGCIEEKILELDNLGELIDSSIAYGVRQHKILRKVVTDYIDNNFSSKFFYKGLFYRTIRSAAPDYWDMGGTSYYRAFLTESKLKLYCLDNFFRLVEIKNIDLKNIEGVSMFDHIKIEGKIINIYYQILRIKENNISNDYYMYSTEKMENSDLPEFNKLLINNGIPELKRKNVEGDRVSTLIAKIFFIIFVIVIFVAIISNMLR